MSSTQGCGERTAHEQTRLTCGRAAGLLAFCSMRLLGMHIAYCPVVNTWKVAAKPCGQPERTFWVR